MTHATTLDEVLFLRSQNTQLWELLAEAAELAADLTEPNMQQSVMHLYARAVELRSKVSALKTSNRT